MAAGGGEGGAVQWWRWGLHVTCCAPIVDRNRICRWGVAEEPRTESLPAPTSLCSAV